MGQHGLYTPAMLHISYSPLPWNNLFVVSAAQPKLFTRKKLGIC